jgi:serine/threonine protein kinase
LIKFAGFNTNGVKIRKNGDVIPVAYIALELISGEFFDFVEYSSLSEKIVRYYFKQLLDVTIYIHEQGYTHRDLKIDNIMLDDNFNIRVTDFGFAAPV